MPREPHEAIRLAWGSAEVADVFARREGFVSAEEARLMERVSTEVRDQPILDIGVGGGRTTSFLRSVSGDYVGIDYLERLVVAARGRYPQARFEHMDARDLSPFGAETFALVVFSFNGIDGLAHPDRHQALTEINRVLRPGGLFAYSTQNLDYQRMRRWPARRDWRTAFGHPIRAIRYAARMPKLRIERRRLAAQMTRGDGWATIATQAYGFAVALHRVTLRAALQELQQAGFTDEIELYAPGSTISIDGRTSASRSAGGLDTSAWPCLHFVARKPRAGER